MSVSIFLAIYAAGVMFFLAHCWSRFKDCASHDLTERIAMTGFFAFGWFVYFPYAATYRYFKHWPKKPD